MTDFRELRPASWQELKDWYYALSLGWVFRGQRKAGWEISSSLERSMRGLPLGPIEIPMVKKFTSRLHHYSSEEAASDSFLETLALMQHHGVPTRLTDWTKSPYVATFFAVEDATDETGECAVWAIVGGWCNAQSIHTIRRKLNLSQADLPMDTDFSTDSNIIKYVFNLREPLVVSIEPQRLNLRITAQQGVFLCQGDINQSLMENLEALGKSDLPRKLYKIVIPNSWRPRILHDLRHMNIAPDSLFPGLDGFARSLKLQFSTLKNSDVSQEIARLWQKYGFEMPI